MSPSVIIHRASDMEAALVLTNFLQFHGFDASLDNAGHASLDWGSVPAFGGIAVRMPRAQVDAARQVLRTAMREADLTNDAAYPHRTRRKRLLAYSMLGIYFGLVQALIAGMLLVIVFVLPESWLTTMIGTPQPADAHNAYYFDYFESPRREIDAREFTAWVLGFAAFLILLERITRPTAHEATGEAE